VRYYEKSSLLEDVISTNNDFSHTGSNKGLAEKKDNKLSAGQALSGYGI
jgi:hypothetical protein